MFVSLGLFPSGTELSLFFRLCPYFSRHVIRKGGVIMCGLASLVPTIGQEACTWLLLASGIWSRSWCITQEVPAISRHSSNCRLGVNRSLLSLGGKTGLSATTDLPCAETVKETNFHRVTDSKGWESLWLFRVPEFLCDVLKAVPFPAFWKLGYSAFLLILWGTLVS